MLDKLVSVIIPTFNRKNTLKKSIISVLGQSYPTLELIVVDDGSEDNTEQMVKEINDPRIKYVKLDKNYGPSHARNVGINESRGEYVAFQDSDDIWLPDKLEKQMRYMETARDYDIVYSGYTVYCGEVKKEYIPAKSIAESDKAGHIYKSLLKSNKIGTPTILLRKTCFEEVGMFNTHLYAIEDWELCLRLSKKYKIGFIDESLVNVYVSNNSVNRNVANYIETFCYILLTYREDLLEFSVMGQKICDLLEYSMYHNSGQTENLKNKLIPSVILNEWEFDTLLYATKRTIKFKKNYQLLSKICESKKAFQNFKEICAANGWKSIAVYGMGNIGKTIIGMLENKSVKVTYGIDLSGESECHINVIKPSEIKEDIDLIIVTVVSEYEKIVSQLRKYTECEIFSVDEFL